MMFDANMRYLDKGRTFFAKVHYCSNCRLYDLGIRGGDILLCEMMTQSEDNPEVKITLDTVDVVVESNEEYAESWLVYEGRTDGSGFIDSQSREKAKKMIGEWWKS